MLSELWQVRPWAESFLPWSPPRHHRPVHLWTFLRTPLRSVVAQALRINRLKLYHRLMDSVDTGKTTTTIITFISEMTNEITSKMLRSFENLNRDSEGGLQRWKIDTCNKLTFSERVNYTTFFKVFPELFLLRIRGLSREKHRTLRWHLNYKLITNACVP